MTTTSANTSANQAWTYETLAQCNTTQLENILMTGSAPDPEQLNGWIYCGWNHELIGKLSGEKFKKGFYKKNGRNFGYNEICEQDSDSFRGAWKVRLSNGRPTQLGYFRSSYVKDEPAQPLYKPYQHLGHLNYDLPDMNKSIYFFFRVIRDFVVLPNPGDHSLMLCKAYLQFIYPSVNVFYCYFLLGHRLKIEHLPW
jgi:hypothetical protein